MARYDRIATLPVPAPADTFGGWLALRDLAGRERDAELGRRLRLHFLVLRPLLRLIAHPDAVTGESLSAQLSRTSEELGVLPLRDPQRAALAELLEAMHGRDPVALTQAALTMARRAQRWEHRSAATAYATCALQLARAAELDALAIAAHRQLADVALADGAGHDAESHAGRAAALALQLGDREEWARATTERAAAAALRGDGTLALALLNEVQARARDWRAPEVGVIGLVAACRHRLAAGDAEGALEQAWGALPTAPRASQRAALLEQIIAALTALGLFAEADHCSSLLEARAAAAQDRLIIRAARARLRAEAGDAAGFQKRAAVLAERPAALPAAARLHLARGALLVGILHDARRHAVAAAQLARTQLLPAVAREASELLAILDRTTSGIVALPRPSGAPGPPARRIAAALLGLGETLAPGLL